MRRLLIASAALALAACDDEAAAPEPEAPEPPPPGAERYYLNHEMPQVGVSRGFFMEDFDARIERSLDEDGDWTGGVRVRFPNAYREAFETRELRQLWVQPGSRVAFLRPTFYDRRYGGFDLDERPHLIVTETGQVGIVRGFPPDVIDARRLARLAVPEGEPKVLRDNCEDSYRRVAVAVRDHRAVIGGRTVRVPRGTLAVSVSPTMREARLRLADPVPGAPGEAEFGLTPDWEIVPDDFCLTDELYSYITWLRWTEAFQRPTRRFQGRQVFVKGQPQLTSNVIERERAAYEAGTTSTTASGSLGGRLSLGGRGASAEAGLSRTSETTSSETLRALASEQLTTGFDGARDEEMEVYVHVDTNGSPTFSRLRAFVGQGDECAGPNWIYSQQSVGQSSVKVSRCALGAEIAGLSVTDHGFIVGRPGDVVRLRDELFASLEGRGDRDEVADFLMRKLVVYLGQDVTMAQAATAIGYAGTQQRGQRLWEPYAVYVDRDAVVPVEGIDRALLEQAARRLEVTGWPSP